ncbi:MAG TPA: SH3 domain-containing protein, partial [Terriglobales bacterium]|nr:SH3 domain-containing protein [Terriglobales bacterium]
MVMPHKAFSELILFLLLGSVLSFADSERGILIREAGLHIYPDANSEKISTASRGSEVAIFEKSHDWVKVFAQIHQDQEVREVTGWILAKGIILTSTPNGDRILFGAAADAEDEASRAHGRRSAATDAMRMYARMAEYFPNSPLAAEALYRAGDIRWQIEYADIMTLPSAKEQDPDVRPKMDEETMRQVIKKYPRTKWADLAAYHLLDNKVCGNWQAQPKCPEKETELYENYVKDHPQSPKAPEALYNAAWRQSALIEIYKTQDQAARSTAAAGKATTLAKRVATEYPDSDWASKALALQYKIEQNIPTYGSEKD